MKGTKFITPSEWAMQSIKESKMDFIDVHFDIFKDYKNQKGLPLLKYASHLLTEARVAASKLQSEEKSFKPFVYIPFGCNFDFMHWDSSDWVKLGENNGQAIYEPPSLYLLAKRELLFANLNIEDYRCPVPFPPDFLFDEQNKILSLFRCYRDNLDVQEFYTGIYLYHSGDF